MPTTVNPTTRTEPAPGGDTMTVTSHPAFGHISFSRVTGHAKLFGSELEHPGFIELSVFPAEETWRLSSRRTRRADNKPLIQLSMSHSQFAEAITSMNCGDGVPCTIGYVTSGGLGHYPRVGQVAKPASEKVKADVAAQRKSITAVADELDAKVAALNLTKAAKQEVLALVAKLHRELDQNLPFIITQYQESVETLNQTARTETEAYITSALIHAGLSTARQAAIEDSKPF